MIKTLVSLSIVLLAATPAIGFDLIYGAGTLPKLASDAQVVVETTDAEVANETPRAIIYSVTPGNAWKGIPGASSILVLCPSAEGVPTAGELKNAALFLRGPLNARQRKFWGVGSEMGDVYQILSAQNGIVSLTGANKTKRRIALHTFLSAADAPNPEGARLQWAQKNVKSTDPFLQESALFEIERQPDSAATLKTLSSTINADLPLTTKALALRIVGDAEMSAAVDILARAATNRRLPPSIRRQAVMELITRPDASVALEKLVKTGDAVVAATLKDARTSGKM